MSFSFKGIERFVGSSPSPPFLLSAEFEWSSGGGAFIEISGIVSFPRELVPSMGLAACDPMKGEFSRIPPIYKKSGEFPEMAVRAKR